MSASPSSRQDKIFYAALCIMDEAKRKAFLERTCAKDPAMQADIEKLLAVQADAEKFFVDCSLLPDNSRLSPL